jgi:hypothetical protein
MKKMKNIKSRRARRFPAFRDGFAAESRENALHRWASVATSRMRSAGVMPRCARLVTILQRTDRTKKRHRCANSTPNLAHKAAVMIFTWPQRRSGHCLRPGFRIASRAAAAALGNACVRTMPLENLDAGRDE